MAKLLNDFSEERRSTKRLRWIRRVAVLLLVLFVSALGLAFMRAKSEMKPRRRRKKLRSSEMRLRRQRAKRTGDSAV